MKELIVICGPTASGKTGLAIQLANQLHTEIISADSRQLYREMAIGTAKPSEEELARAHHHFIHSHSVSEPYSAGDFEEDVLRLLSQLFQKHEQVILVGGSGLYIQAVCEGFDDLPKSDPVIRKKLKDRLRKEGLEQLFSELKEKDPDYARQVNPNNSQRVIRALEVIAISGQTFSSFRQENQSKRRFTCRKYLIDWDRQLLYERINQRVDQMLEDGLEEEAKQLYPLRHLNALQTVGYNEFFDYFDGKISKKEAIRLIKRNTRRYAKRQLTWFRRDEDIVRLSPDELDQFVANFNA